MARRITARYAGHCKVCGEPYAAGDEIYWSPDGKGNLHLHCLKEESKGFSSIEDGLPVFSQHWDDLKTAYLAAVDDCPEKVLKLPGNQKRIRELRGGSWLQGSWTGCTIDEMRTWLASGYKSDAFQNLAADIRPRKKRRIKFSEEGELQYDLMLSGVDYPFLEWEKRENRPGLKVDIFQTFSANVRGEVVANYSRWLAKTLYSLETEGYDLEVGIRFDGKERGVKAPPTGIRVIVKRENEASDFSQWSPLFSPGGFRMLGFTCMIQAMDHFGYVASSGLGYGLNEKDPWQVKFDAENRQLFIGCPYQTTSFPEDDMERMLREALSEAH